MTTPKTEYLRVLKDRSWYEAADEASLLNYWCEWAQLQGEISKIAFEVVKKMMENA